MTAYDNDPRVRINRDGSFSFDFHEPFVGRVFPTADVKPELLEEAAERGYSGGFYSHLAGIPGTGRLAATPDEAIRSWIGDPQ